MPFAGGHHIGPLMCSPTAPGDDVIHGVSGTAAVGTSIGITRQDRSTRKGGLRRSIRDFDKRGEPDDRRDRQGHRRRMKRLAIAARSDNFSPFAQHHDDGSSRRDELEWFKCRVEKKHSLHGDQLTVAGPEVHGATQSHRSLHQNSAAWSHRPRESSQVGSANTLYLEAARMELDATTSLAPS
jgi:hypothetical protein